MVYEIVTGRKAFEGKSQASLIAAILEREPPAMSELQGYRRQHSTPSSRRVWLRTLTTDGNR